MSDNILIDTTSITNQDMSALVITSILVLEHYKDLIDIRVIQGATNFMDSMLEDPTKIPLYSVLCFGYMLDLAFKLSAEFNISVPQNIMNSYHHLIALVEGSSIDSEWENMQ